MNKGPFPGGGTAVLQTIDVVSYGGGVGGGASFRLHNFTTFLFWTINIGSDSDAFSWRGSIPLVSTDEISMTVVGDTGMEVVMNGMWVPTEYFAV